jgi:hypothetical protein
MSDVGPVIEPEALKRIVDYVSMDPRFPTFADSSGTSDHLCAT